MSFRTIVFSLVPLVVLFFLGELLVTAWAPDVRGTTFFQTNQYGLKSYVEDQSLFWKAPVATDEKITAARADRGRRMIVTLGGSIAQGSSPRHFTALLNERYRDRETDATFHNLALAGYTTHQSRVMLESIVPPASPRIVLVCNGFNDSCHWWKQTDREIAMANHHWSRSLLEILNHRRLFAWLRYQALQVETKSSHGFEPGGRTRIPLDHYRENLTAIAERTAKAGGATVLITQAMPSRRNAETVRPYFDVMGEIAAARTDTFLCDVRPAFLQARREHGVSFMEDEGVDLDAGNSYRNRLFIDGDCHVTDEGYSLMADAMEKVIDENRLLEDR